MLRVLAGALLCVVVPVFAFAEPDPMAAAGRIERGDSPGTCSAALIAPDLVITAGHCVGDPDRLLFRPGGRIGETAVPVVDAIHHPLYDPTHDPTLWKFRFDFALLKLEREISPAVAVPFPLGPSAKLNEVLFLVSWKDTPRPRQRQCQVIPGYRGLVTLACAVRGGESGAPVLRMTPDGPGLVAVISSRTNQGPQPVAQASDAELRLPPMVRLMD